MRTEGRQRAGHPQEEVLRSNVDPLPPVTTGRFAALRIASALGRCAHTRNSPSGGPAVLPFGPSRSRALYFLIPQLRTRSEVPRQPQCHLRRNRPSPSHYFIDRGCSHTEFLCNPV